MSKIGVFICHCGENISATVDCEKVAEAAAKMDGVACAIDYKYMCSDPGQTLIKQAIKEYGLDGRSLFTAYARTDISQSLCRSRVESLSL